MTAVIISMMIRLPPDTVSTISVITRPMPVSDTVPTMMPAVAVAMPTEVMLREAPWKAAIRSSKPSRKRAAKARSPRNAAIKRPLREHDEDEERRAPEGRQAGRQFLHHQAPDQDDDRQQKCRPVRAVSKKSGTLTIAFDGSSCGRSGWRRLVAHQRDIDREQRDAENPARRRRRTRAWSSRCPNRRCRSGR